MSGRQKIEFKIVQRDLEILRRSVNNREPISSQRLAKILRNWGSEPLPTRWRAYICDLLEGKIERKRGRKPAPKLSLVEQPRFQKSVYEVYLRLAQKRKKQGGRFAALGKARQDNMCYNMPANEVAARLTARRLGFADERWRTLQNNFSSQK